MLFFGFIILIFFCCSICLSVISLPFKYGLEFAWGDLVLFKYKRYLFFIAKAAAYRRIFAFFTFLSYTLRMLAVISTFFIIYCIIDSSILSNKELLVFSALCDGISLLFPFQKYIDLFSECCVKMEESLLTNDVILSYGENIDSQNLNQLKQIVHNNLLKSYIECENLLHLQNKI